jgi:hypothetical protein
MKMKRIFVYTGGLAVIVTLTIGMAYGMGMGCGMSSGSHDQNEESTASMPDMSGQCDMTDTTSAMGCPLMIQGARMTMKDVPDGVQIVLTAADSATIERIRAQARRVMTMRDGATEENASGARSSATNRSRSSSQAVTYTCPMHPEVVSSRPGSCPKCGMTLSR